jgi:RNA polymerase sigma-70 factor (ECF subfamily)
MSRPRSSLNEASDVDLVAALATGSDDVVVELYRRHAGAVRTRAMQVVGDRGLAEGVVQEVFLRFWLHPDLFDAERGTLRAYLTVQARSRAIGLRRSAAARKQREARSDAAIGQRTIDATVEQEVVDRVIAEHVRARVAGLPEIERVAIEAAYFDDHSYRDVASLLDRPEGTVKTRIRSGLGHLRASLRTEVTVDLRDR